MSLLARARERLAAHSPRAVVDPVRQQAAVALILVPDPDRLLLIRRAIYSRDPWSGQMGLPGGRRDAADPDLHATAVRETDEELSLTLTDDALIGVLDDLAPLTPVLPPIVVRPHVFALQREPEGITLSAEVQYLRWASFSELTQPGTYRSYAFEHQGVTLVRPAFHLGDDVVWGMTERILTPFLRLLGLEIPPVQEQR